MTEEQTKESSAAVAESPYLEAALRYASMGWRVFPVKREAKEPAIKGWPERATRKKETIQKWWDKEPVPNVGILTGETSGIVVLDVDPRNGGDVSLKELEDKHGKLPNTIECQTGGGGRHLYFKYPSGGVGSSKGFLPGLDFQGNGRFVIAPPSIHPETGNFYEWKAPPFPEDSPLAEAPKWLLEILTSSIDKRATPAKVEIPPITDGEGIPKGRRNRTLTSVAGFLRSKGLVGEEILPTLHALNEVACVDEEGQPYPLPPEEIEDIADWVSKKPLDCFSNMYMGNMEYGKSFSFAPIAEPAGPGREPSWLVDKMLPAGGVSILSGRPKAGKSTLARNLAVSVANGGEFLDRKVQPGVVLYLAFGAIYEREEQLLRKLGGKPDKIKIYTGAPLLNGLEALSNSIAEHKPALVIVDNLLNLVRIEDGNDYPEVGRKLEPIITLARSSGCHLTFIHHAGKAQREGGDAMIGSTAYFAAPDTIITISVGDKGRVVETEQRYGEALPKTILALDWEAGRITTVGDLEEIRSTDLASRIKEHIGEKEIPQKEILDHIGGNPAGVLEVLRTMADRGVLIRTGRGVKGAPLKYRVASLPETRFDPGPG